MTEIKKRLIKFVALPLVLIGVLLIVRSQLQINQNFKSPPNKNSPGGSPTAGSAVPAPSPSADIWDSLPAPLAEKAKALGFTRGSITPSDTRTITLAVDLDRAEAERQATVKKLADAEAKLASAKAAKKVADAEEQAKAQLLAAAEAKVSVLEGEIGNLQKQGASARDAAKSRIDKLQQELRNATQTLAKAVQDAKTQADAKAQADTEVAKLTQELAALKAAAAKVAAPPAPPALPKP